MPSDIAAAGAAASRAGPDWSAEAGPDWSAEEDWIAEVDWSAEGGLSDNEAEIVVDESLWGEPLIDIDLVVANTTKDKGLGKGKDEQVKQEAMEGDDDPVHEQAEAQVSLSCAHGCSTGLAHRYSTGRAQMGTARVQRKSSIGAA